MKQNILFGTIIAVALLFMGLVSAYFLFLRDVDEDYLDISVCYVYPAITDDKVLPTDTIPNRYMSNVINIKGSPGEFRPASFVLYAINDISSLTAKVSDLTGPRGKIGSNSIDIRIVKTWYQAGVDVRETDSKVLTPELLLKDDSLVKVQDGENYLKLKDGTYRWISDPNKDVQMVIPYTIDELPVQDSADLLPVDIKAGINQQFWITVEIPRNAVPGKYSGKIILTSREGAVDRIDINLEVLPITLSDPLLTYSLYYTGILDSERPQGSISSYFKSEEQFRKEMQNLLDHGVSNPTVYQGFGTELFDRVLTIRNELGMDKEALYYLGLTPWGYQPVDKVVEVIAQAQKHGIGQVYFYGVDEASGTELTDQRASWQAIREAGGKIFVAGRPPQGDDPGNYALMGDITDLLICQDEPSEIEAAKWHSSGHQIFSYANPQVGVELPETYRRNYGLLLWQKDYDGAMDWAYQYGFSNIWNDFDNVYYRDEVFTYPTIDGVIDTIQWEGFREGVYDVRYLTTLLDTIKSAKEKGKDTSAVENWLAGLKQADLTQINLDSVREDMINHILSLL